MKKAFITICVVILLMSCSQHDGNAPEVFTSDTGTTVKLQNKWFVSKETVGGNSNVRLRGTTNADSLFITTNGFGLLNKQKVTMNSGAFDSEFVVSAYSSVPDGPFQSFAMVTAYRGSEMYEMMIESPDLKFD